MKTLKHQRKELRRTVEDEKTSHVLNLSELKIWKWLCLKKHYRSTQALSHSNDVLFRTRERILKLGWKHKRQVKATWSREEHWVTAVPDFTVYNKPQWTQCGGHKSRQTNQWNRIQDPEINLVTCPPPILTKMSTHTFVKRQPLQQMIPGKLDTHTKRTKSGVYLILYPTQIKNKQRP